MNALVLLAVGAALWIWPPARWVLCRVVEPPPPVRGEPRWLGVRRGDDDRFAVAATMDLFAVCLRAGLPVVTALRISHDAAPATLAARLERVADLLELGADPDQAWAVDVDGDIFSDTDGFDALATLARRSSRAGSALSDGLTELAADTRARANDDATAAAERAGVAISGPLGLCFLPAFVFLGIVPVVIGLATSMLG